MKTLRRVRDVMLSRELWRWVLAYIQIAIAGAAGVAFWLVIFDPAPGELYVMRFFALVAVAWFTLAHLWRWWRYGP